MIRQVGPALDPALMQEVERIARAAALMEEVERIARLAPAAGRLLSYAESQTSVRQHVQSLIGSLGGIPLLSSPRAALQHPDTLTAPSSSMKSIPHSLLQKNHRSSLDKLVFSLGCGQHSCWVMTERFPPYRITSCSAAWLTNWEFELAEARRWHSNLAPSHACIPCTTSHAFSSSTVLPPLVPRPLRALSCCHIRWCR